jgi:hypothetical protein
MNQIVFFKYPCNSGRGFWLPFVLSCLFLSIPVFSSDSVPLSTRADFGSEDPLFYPNYGEFQNLGTADYKFIIRDRAGLARAAGAGVFPNVMGLDGDNEYRKLLRNKKI